jgi:hypothetical protein
VDYLKANSIECRHSYLNLFPRALHQCKFQSCDLLCTAFSCFSNYCFDYFIYCPWNFKWKRIKNRQTATASDRWQRLGGVLDETGLHLILDSIFEKYSSNRYSLQCTWNVMCGIAETNCMSPPLSAVITGKNYLNVSELGQTRYIPDKAVHARHTSKLHAQQWPLVFGLVTTREDHLYLRIAHISNKMSTLSSSNHNCGQHNYLFQHRWFAEAFRQFRSAKRWTFRSLLQWYMGNSLRRCLRWQWLCSHRVMSQPWIQVCRTHITVWFTVACTLYGHSGSMHCRLQT